MLWNITGVYWTMRAASLVRTVALRRRGVGRKVHGIQWLWMALPNCMPRLRINVKDDGAVNEESLKGLEGVMGIVHDRANYWEVV